MSEARNDGIAIQTLAAADKAVRDAIAKHGPQSPNVVEMLAQYGSLLHEFGYEEQASRVRERVAKMREALERRMSREVPAVTAEPEPERAPETESAVDLFNSRGEHIAVFVSGNLYTPSGTHIGRWSDDMEVFLSRKGNYLGVIGYENRLVRDKNWQFRNVNFGDRGNEGSRTGFMHKRDIDSIVLDPWLEDPVIDEKE